MYKSKNIVVCAVVSLLILLAPVAGADMASEVGAGFIRFRGFNLLEVSALGLLPAFCPLLTILTFKFSNLRMPTKIHIAGMLSILSAVGWICGTMAAKKFLLDMESIEPVVIEYGCGMPTGIVLNLVTIVISLCLMQRVDQGQ